MAILEQFQLNGKVAIVTGGGKGIGAAIARGYAEAGADIVVAARTRSDIEPVAAEVRAAGGRAIAVPTDLMQEKQLLQLVAATLEEFGRIDVLVNNTDGSLPKPALDTSTLEFDMAFRFHVATAFALTRIAAPRMVESAGGGAIVNVSSVVGHPPQDCAAQGTARAALFHLTRALAREFAPQVRVNAIAAGSTASEAPGATPDAAEVERKRMEMKPPGRPDLADDVAASALYLAAPASAWVSGNVLALDGGLPATNWEPSGRFG